MGGVCGRGVWEGCVGGVCRRCVACVGGVCGRGVCEGCGRGV